MGEFIKKNFNFSMKNIPIQSEDSYLKNLIYSVEKFVTRIRWKTLFFLKRKEQDNKEYDSDDDVKRWKEKFYGFNSTNVPPYIKELARFENDLWNLVESVKFSKKRSKFQKELSKEIVKIKKSEHLLIPADKTGNMYTVKPDTYNKLLSNNITKDYQKSKLTTVKHVNLEAKEITTKLRIADRVEAIPEQQAFITLKDHKQNFQNQPQCRLINPTKTKIGTISKTKLQKIQKKRTREITWFNQPYNESVTTNLGKQFLKIIDINFPTTEKTDSKKS